MRAGSLLVALLCALSVPVPGLAQRVPPACRDAFEFTVGVKEQLVGGGLSTDQLSDLHTRVKRRTADCPDLADLWKVRGTLAELLKDQTDVDVVKARHAQFFLTDMPARRGTFDPATPVGQRWALLAGTNSFAFKSGLRVHDLEYAEADVKSIGQTLSSTLGFTNVETLLGDQFTMERWRLAIARLREQVKAEDLVVVYLASHGRPKAQDRNYTSFVLTHSSRDDRPGDIYTTSIQVVDLVQELYRELQAQRVIILLDACFSGDAISGQRDYAGHPAPHLLDAFTRGAGRAVVAAAGATQKSWELPDRSHGAFAYCFTKAATTTATLGETFARLQTCVSSEVKTALGGSVEQVPQMFASDGARRIVLGSAAATSGAGR